MVKFIKIVDYLNENDKINVAAYLWYVFLKTCKKL